MRKGKSLLEKEFRVIGVLNSEDRKKAEFFFGEDGKLGYPIQYEDDLSHSLFEREAFFIVSEEFRDQSPWDCFAFFREGEVFIKLGEKEFENLDLEFVLNREREIFLLKQDFLILGESISSELKRLRDFNERFFPKRKGKTTGLSFVSKYKTGSHSGGDFFDCLESEEKLTFVLLSTNSYLFLGKISKLIGEMKSFSIYGLEEIIKSVETLRYSFSKGHRDIDLEMLILEIDKKNLIFSGHAFGGGSVWSSTHGSFVDKNSYPVETGFSQRCFFSGSLSRGDSLILLSPGGLRNWKKKWGLKEYSELFKAHGNGEDFLEEFFLKIYEEDLLEYDTSMVFINVDKGGVYEIK